MNTVFRCIKERRSVRTYDGRLPDEDTKAKLMSFSEGIKNPLDIPVAFKFLEAERDGLSCPVVSGTDLYIGGKIRNCPDANLAFGYSFEVFVLYAQSLGLGTVWLGGTMNRSAYEKAMELGSDELMPCACAIGYASDKMSVKESMMRKTIKADDRLPFETLFFDRDFDRPVSKDSCGRLTEVLEMVRLAPSAVNKQPWRLVLRDEKVHFYLRRNKGFRLDGPLDMQMVDMGIALCHFALAAEERGLDVRFERINPEIPENPGFEYIATYVLEQ